jgi:SpoVK/Ycf46/Vps4 family AAA+-type ATPase
MKQPIRTDTILKLLPKLTDAALSSDRGSLESVCMMIIRLIRAEYPDLAGELSQSLAKSPTRTIRGSQYDPIPADHDEGLALLKLDDRNWDIPFMATPVHDRIQRFVRERKESATLLQRGITPPRSLLLTGPPGTGKTVTARWIASDLSLPLFVLDLANVISSFLGKTGSNLRRSLDYARASPCVLLLDEFDSIAKRRNDDTEIGELKRIVNVLLKELEEWPMHSVLIAATNHPELLDRAISRRFDVVIDIPLPGEEERECILDRVCGTAGNELPPIFLRLLAQHLNNHSGSEIETMTQAAMRSHLLDGISLEQSLTIEMVQLISHGLTKKQTNDVIKMIGSMNMFTVREIGSMFSRSPSGIQYQLKKEVSDA